MKLWSVAAIFVFAALPPVLSLKCYTCSSTESWDKCKEESTTCLSGFDQCVKVYLKAGPVETFTKGCGIDASCDSDTNPICKGAVGSSIECKINCCTGDDCNAGTAIRISGILLLSCALVSLMIFSKA